MENITVESEAIIFWKSYSSTQLEWEQHFAN